MYVHYYPIEVFPKDGIWRIDWFGEVSRNPYKESDPDIEVIMSPFVGKRSKPATNTAVDNTKQSIYRVGVGILPLLHIGSMWKNQRRLSMSGFDYDRETFRNLTISPETMRIVQADHITSEGPLIPENYFYVGNSSGKAARCLTIERNGDPYHIIIPMVEVIRFYYALSTGIAKVLFRGDLEDNPNALYVREETAFADDKSTLQITLNKEYSEVEAWTIARMATSEDIMLPHAKRIHSSIVKNSLGGFSVPETYPPFYGNTTLIVRGKWIKYNPRPENKSEDVWRFLVFWMETCSAPFPFQKLEVKWPFLEPPTSTEAEGENVPGAEKPTVRTRTRRNTEEVDVPVKNYVEPYIKSPRMRMLLNTDRFPDLASKKMTIVNLEKRKLRKAPAGPEGKDPDGVSTGDGAYNGTNVRKISVITNPDGSKPDETRPPSPFLEDFKQALQALTSMKDCKMSCEILSEPALFPFGNGDPELKWSMLYGGWRRQVIVAEVTFNKHFFYILESEHRIVKESDNVEKKEHYTTLLAYSRDSSGDFAKLDADKLNEILVNCAKNEGKWFKEDEIPELSRRKFKHTWKTPEQFADRVREYICSVVTSEPADVSCEPRESANASCAPIDSDTSEV